MEIYRIYLFALAILGLVIFVYFAFFILSLFRPFRKKSRKTSDEIVMSCHIPAWKASADRVDISDIPESAEDLLDE
ncbi:MAG TPA: hypothetical protein PKK48_02880 [Phycisphaerae bacterium]|nr:hypothetical protein [Phycisphaerae bacterium]